MLKKHPVYNHMHALFLRIMPGSSIFFRDIFMSAQGTVSYQIFSSPWPLSTLIMRFIKHIMTLTYVKKFLFLAEKE